MDGMWSRSEFVDFNRDNNDAFVFERIDADRNRLIQHPEFALLVPQSRVNPKL